MCAVRKKNNALQKILFVGVISLLSVTSQSQDLVSKVITPWADPLQANPSVIEVGGSILPGDKIIVPCTQYTNIVNAEEELSLSRAVDLALCNNSQVKSTWAAIKIESAALGEARGRYLPTLSISASRINDTTRYPESGIPISDITSNTAYANFSWRMFDFGGRNADRQSANELLNSALANHDAVIQKILISVVTNYFDAQTKQATLVARQRNEILARQIFETFQHKEARGAGSRSDSLQAEASLAKASLDKSRSQGAFRKSLSILVYTLGLPTSANIKLAEDLVDNKNNIQQDLDEWLLQTEKQHPAIIAARAQLESARQQIASVRAEGLPTLDITGSYYQNGHPNQGVTSIQTRENSIGITLTIPIFNGFSNTYRVRGAQARVEQKTADLEDTKQQILMETVKAYADANTALNNLNASEELLNTAKEALFAVQHKFDKGVADVLEILNAQSVLSDAELERIQCLADWRAARLTLFAEAGILGKNEIDNQN